jgi:peptidoglycan/xylan/chitin deacetylase (PgdA/CDA1 family)
MHPLEKLVVGQALAAHPELGRRMLAEGHRIANQP